MLVAAGGEPATFSHRRHAPLKLPCVNCHTGAKKAERAGFPAVSNCMVCHQVILKERPAIRRLAGLPRDAKAFPSTKRPALPDFVFFSHARHAAAEVACEGCHGAVLEMDSVPLEAPRTMKACVECHTGRKATLVCNACHELNQ